LRIVLFSNNPKRKRAVKRELGDHFVLEIDGGNVNSEKFVKKISAFGPDLMIVAGFPQIFKKPLLDVCECWNCHAGPLPGYRGGSPLNWQIIDGRKELGVSLIRMEEGIDTGPVLAFRKFPFSRDETIKDAHRKANRAFGELVRIVLDRYVSGKPLNAVRGAGGYRKQRTDEDGEIDLGWDAERIHDFVRALTKPYPGAFLRIGDKKLRIWSTSVG